MDIATVTRSYTLRLASPHPQKGDAKVLEPWREQLWDTHVTVSRGTQIWGAWLLSLRGALPASLADSAPDRRVLLALSWLSVETSGEKGESLDSHV